jgi:hypothetical protein
MTTLNASESASEEDPGCRARFVPTKPGSSGSPASHFRRPGLWTAALALTLLLCMLSPLHAQQLRLLVTPQALIPVTDRDVFGAGIGASLSLQSTLTDFAGPWAGLRIASVSPAASDLNSSLLLTSLGGGLELYFFPTARLKIGVTLGGGAYVGSYRSGTTRIPTGNLYWEAGADAGYRLSPDMTLSGGISYVDLRQETGSLLGGLTISARVDLGLELGSPEGRAVLEEVQSAPVYPILAEKYEETSFGTVSIRNGESAEIRNVEVWFSAPGYTSSPRLCGEAARMSRGEQAEFPLYAYFSDEVMTVTELLRTTGEVVVSYELLGEGQTSRTETTIAVANRNAFTWQDPRILASFVSTNDSALMDLSKFIAGVVRSESRTEVDDNLQYALALLEGLRLSGIAWSPDPQTPYAAMRQTTDTDDYVQYPHQTIAYSGGDSDDLAVLYAAALQSVGVPAALIPLDDDVLVAARLGISADEATNFFSSTADLLLVEDSAWVPVRVSVLREGFLRAWSEGGRLVRESDAADESFYPVTEAWGVFPSVGVPGIEVVARRPDEEDVIRAFTNLLTLLVEREVNPRAQAIRDSFGPDGGSGRQLNRLGILYARYGVYQEALVEFQAAYEAGYRRAIVNIGNIAFLLQDYETALAWFELAYEQNPNDSIAVLGLARTYYELDRYEETDRFFEQARELDPNVAEEYSYLSARISDAAGRASAAADRLGNMIWDE